MPISWYQTVMRRAKRRNIKVKKSTQKLLKLYDSFLNHPSVPESTHEEFVKSERWKGKRGGCYDLITTQPGYSDVKKICIKHAGASGPRQFFKNRLFRTINTVLNDEDYTPIDSERGGDDE